MKTEYYLTCKQNFKRNNKTIFEIGKTYKTYDSLKKNAIFVYYDEYSIYPNERGYTFYRNDSIYIEDHLLIEYFNSIQQERKEKLLKIYSTL